MHDLRILYKNLELILTKELSKLAEFTKELKTCYYQQDSKLNETLEQTTKLFQGYQLVESEISSMQNKVIAKGEKITSSVLNKIFQLKNPNTQIIHIMKIVYEILRQNIDMMKENSSNDDENINWEFLKKKVEKNSILLLLSKISETSTLNMSKEIMKNWTPINSKYNQYKNIYMKNFPEIMVILDFIEVLMVFYTKLTMLQKLYVSNQNKGNKLETIQSDINKNRGLMDLTQLFLAKISKDFENYKKSLENKDKSNRMIYGYNILEKYSLYEKYIVSEEYIFPDEDYNSEYYNNYGGDTFNNLKKKKRYVIKLDKKYSKKEKFIQQLSSSLLTYTKGTRRINIEKFIKAINENRNTSVHKNSSNTNSFSKSKNKNKNNISILSNNNILMRSMESNNSSVNLKGSFHTNQTNPIINLTRINNSPFRNENSRNTTNTIFYKRSFVESNPTFDNIYQISNRNTSFKDGLNISSNDCDLTQTKFTNKTIVNTHDVNSVKNTKAKGKKRNTVCATNIKRTQLNLKIEDEQQYSLCNFCCKNMENKINEICENK
jgi:hypothetical protein